MNLHPDAQRLLEIRRQAGRPPMETQSPADARRSMLASRAVLAPDPPEVAEARDLVGGGVKLRLYRAFGTAVDTALPAVIYFHGGGFVVGDLDTHDIFCRQLANAIAGAVIAVDYRLSPEHKFPAAVEDALAASRWIFAQAAALALDPARLAVAGDSAGGNLAAMVALTARGAGDLRIGFQVLIYPVLDLGMSHDSYRRNAEGYTLTAAAMRWYRDHYLADPAQAADWRASPLLAADLAGAPPALVLTAGCDPLCDEGEAYAQRLAAAGVPATYRCYADQMHGFIGAGRVIRAADTALAEIGAALRQAWAGAA